MDGNLKPVDIGRAEKSPDSPERTHHYEDQLRAKLSRGNSFSQNFEVSLITLLIRERMEITSINLIHHRPNHSIVFLVAMKLIIVYK